MRETIVVDSNILMILYEYLALGIITPEDVEKAKNGNIIEPPRRIRIKFLHCEPTETEPVYLFEVKREFSDGRVDQTKVFVPLFILLKSAESNKLKKDFEYLVSQEGNEISFVLQPNIIQKFNALASALNIIDHNDNVALYLYEVQLPVTKKGNEKLSGFPQLYLIRRDEEILDCPSVDFIMNSIKLISSKILREELIEKFKMGINEVKPKMDKIIRKYEFKEIWNPDMKLEIDIDIEQKDYKIILERENYKYNLTIKDISNDTIIAYAENKSLNEIERELSTVLGIGIGLEESEEFIKRIKQLRKIGKIKYASMSDLILRSYKEAGNYLSTNDLTLLSEITATLIK